jgi:hypothetical protein
MLDDVQELKGWLYADKGLREPFHTREEVLEVSCKKTILKIQWDESLMQQVIKWIN